jgi:hypothetical protein
MTSTGKVDKVGEGLGQVVGSDSISGKIFQRSKSLDSLNSQDNNSNKVNTNISGTESLKIALNRSLTAKISTNNPVSETKVKELDNLKKGVEQIGNTTTISSVKSEINRINNLTQSQEPKKNSETPPPNIIEPSETNLNNLTESQPVHDDLTSTSAMLTKSGNDTTKMFAGKPVNEPKLTLGEKIKKFFGPSLNKQERTAIKSEFNNIAKKYDFGLSKEERISKMEAIKGFLKDNTVNMLSGGAAIGLGGKSIQTADKVLTDFRTKNENTRIVEKLVSGNEATSLAGGLGGAIVGGGIGFASKGVSFITALKSAVESGLEAKDFDKIAKELKAETKNIEREIKDLNKILRQTNNIDIRQELIAKKEILIQKKEGLEHAMIDAKSISKELKLNTAEKTLQAGANAIQIGSTLTSTAATITGTAIAYGAKTTTEIGATVVTGAISGAASGVTGVIDIGIGTVGIAKDSYSFVKNAKLKYDAVKFSENPAKAVEISYEKKLAGLGKQLKKLEKKGNSEEIQNQKLRLQESISKVKNKLVDIKNDAIIFDKGSPEAKMAVNRKYAFTENISAITEQTINRRGLGYKGLSISNNVLKVTAGAVSTGGTIATATGVGAPVGAVMTPVGWGMSATSSVNSIMLNVYKLKTTLTRSNKASNLQKQHQDMTKFTTNLENKIKATKLNLDIAKNNPSSGINTFNEEIDLKKMEKDLASVNKLKSRLEVQMNKKDPKFAINTIITTLNKKVPTNATPEEKEKIRTEVVMAKAMLRNIYQVDPKSLMTIDQQNPQRASLEKIQKKAIKKLESKIQIFA